MPSNLPAGDPVPDDGRLPASALRGLGERPLAFYVHVPFCTVRCGYCDFNTYTATELGPGVNRASYADQAIAEIRWARRVLGATEVPVATVFVGGGTPTLLPAEDLIRIRTAIEEEFGLEDGVEVTTEANPDTLTPEYLARLREGGFTRLSVGMQSAVPQVLATLDRTHDPERVPAVVEWAREAGFTTEGSGGVSLDLIYGTPGESPADWVRTVETALASEPDHISAYSLIVEDGTAMARRVRRGELSAPEEDDLADKYTAADGLLRRAGLEWYEVSNWARTGAHRCRHNLLYWTGADWWGVGPGSHSHVGGVRWWNVKHPAAYADRLASGRTPAHAREVLGSEARRMERVMLELRISDGLPLEVLDRSGRAAVPEQVARGLVRVHGERLVLTDAGRLLADGVVRDLLA